MRAVMWVAFHLNDITQCIPFESLWQGVSDDVMDILLQTERETERQRVEERESEREKHRQQNS